MKSTGPKTPEGKARSRANALKHGLCASIVVSEDIQLVQERCDEFFDALKPQNEYQCWLVDKIAVHSLRVDRCERMERRIRDKSSLRAELTWDDDCRLVVESIGGMLPRKPAETVESLRQTPQGCDWLMARWALLAHAAVTHSKWTADQTALAFDLLATPPQFREGFLPGTGVDLDGNIVESADDPAAVARRMVAELKERREVVAGLDEVERALAEADLSGADDTELKKLRRYEASLHSRIRWFVAQLHSKNVHEKGFPSLRSRWHGREDPEPQPRPEPKTPDEILAEHHNPNRPTPPFDLTPDEVPTNGQKADIPKILQSRKEKKLAKAEQRRDAERRKIERLRA